jgi:hypothetical protein
MAIFRKQININEKTQYTHYLPFQQGFQVKDISFTASPC